MKADERTIIYRLKGIAVMCIVLAHVCRVEENFGEINRIAGRVLSSLGSIGVPVFMIISGYLFAKSRKSTPKAFFKARFTGLLIPWFFWASLIYLYVFFGEGYSFISWLKFTVGIGAQPSTCTPFYYMSMISVMYILYFKFKKNMIFIYISMVLSLFSILLTSLDSRVYDAFLPFINPLNWMLYFGIGLVIAKKGSLSDVINRLKKYWILGGIIFAVITAGAVYSGENIAYWKWYALPAFFAAMVFFSGVMDYGLKERDILSEFGYFSFAVFLVHSPIASVAENLKNRTDSVILTLLAPILVCIIVFAIIYFGEKAAEKLRCEKIYNIVLGLRRRKE